MFCYSRQQKKRRDLLPLCRKRTCKRTLSIVWTVDRVPLSHPRNSCDDAESQTTSASEFLFAELSEKTKLPKLGRMNTNAGVMLSHPNCPLLKSDSSMIRPDRRLSIISQMEITPRKSPHLRRPACPHLWIPVSRCE